MKLKQLQSWPDSLVLDWSQSMPADPALASPLGTLGLGESILRGLRDGANLQVLEGQCMQALQAIAHQLPTPHRSPDALEAICATAIRHCMHHKGKGMPQAFYPSKDGSTLAVLHEHHQITELRIDALLQPEPRAVVSQAPNGAQRCTAPPQPPQDVFQGDGTHLPDWQALELVACATAITDSLRSAAVQVFAVPDPSDQLAPAVVLGGTIAPDLHPASIHLLPEADEAISLPVHDPAQGSVPPVPLPDTPGRGVVAKPWAAASLSRAAKLAQPKAASEHLPQAAVQPPEPPLTATQWQERATTLHAQGQQMAQAATWAAQRGLSQAAKAYQHEVHALYIREQDASRRAVGLRAKSQASAPPPAASNPFAPGWGTGDAAAGLRSVPWRSYCGQESYKVSVRAFGAAADYDPVKNQVLFAGVQLGSPSVRAAAGHSCGFMSDEMAPMVKFTASIGAGMGGEATFAIGFNGIKGTISAVGRQRLGHEKSPSIEPKGKDIFGFHPKVKGIWGLSFSAAAGVGYMHTPDPHPMHDGRPLKQ